MEANPSDSQQAGRRLLIIGCSRAKRKTEELLPALQRYDGPVFRVIRKQLSNCAADPPDIYVLSGKFGLIPAEQEIPHYDQPLAKLDVEPLAASVRVRLGQVLARTTYREVLIHASGRYLEVLRAAWGLGSQPLVAVGPPGARLSVVRAWLACQARTSAQANDHSAGQPRIRGVTVIMDSAAIIAVAEGALGTQSAHGADRFITHCVPIGEHLVSPKWLVARITGLSVRQFGTTEAVRVLNQLGIETRECSGTKEPLIFGGL